MIGVFFLFKVVLLIQLENHHNFYLKNATIIILECNKDKNVLNNHQLFLLL